MKLFFFRHSIPEVVNGKFYESHLSDKGKEKVIDFIARDVISKPKVVFSSNYNRSVDTAKIFSDYFSVEVKIRSCLREWDLQSLNLMEEYVEQEKMGWKNHSLKVMGGESLDDVKRRIVDCVKYIVNDCSQDDALLIVSHGTVIDLLCSDIAGREAKFEDLKDMDHLDYAIIEYLSGNFSMVKDIIEK